MLTPRQQQLLDFISQTLQQTGASPSLREMARRFRVSYGTVQSHLAALQKKGSLAHAKFRHRAAVPSGWNPGVTVPLLGMVHAGVPVLAEENIESRLAVDNRWGKGTPGFALRVKGDSMEGASILNGDLVLVRPQATAESGDIVVARNQEETTVKYFRRRSSGPLLEPANPRYSPLPARDFTILGKVVGVLRHLEK